MYLDCAGAVVGDFVEENPSAFKHMINPAVVKLLAHEIHHFYPAFPKKEFIKLASELDHLELKARVLLLTAGMKKTLPDSYPQALKIIVDVIKNGKLSGFQLWPVSEFIGQFGLDHFDASMEAMFHLTQKFTSEFAIRPFLLKDHKKVLKYFLKWTQHKDVHVRRWVSEGSRPILPWGGKIPVFIMDPIHTLILLEKLKFDEELYVRKSVANHLNDISKNHPAVVIKVLKMWDEDCPTVHKTKLEWIKKQALRTLIKKGHKDALKIMGVGGEAQIKFHSLTLNQKKYRLGDSLKFDLVIESSSKKRQKLIIDYVIGFVKANGSTSSKVFKLKSLELKPGEKILISKKHALKKITTMTFYKGTHHLSIQINGKIYEKASWPFLP